MSDKINDVQKEVEEVVQLERQLANINNQIASNPAFVEMLQQQRDLSQRINLFWDTVKNAMIDSDIKSIKGDWGYVTLAERKNYKVDMDALPSKFLKKVADTTKIGNYEKLEGKLPAGVTIEHTRYITKKIKEVE